jgi:hypothetical protein
MGSDSVSHNGATWRITRLARARRQNGIPAPEEWMW